MQQTKGSFNGDKASPSVPRGSPSKCSAPHRVCKRYTHGPKKMGRNHEDSTSPPQSTLSLDSDEDQMAISEMLKSNDKFDNSSGQCSVADDELPRCKMIATLGEEKGADGASMGAASDEKLGNNDCPNETPWMHLEARISRLDRLAAEKKAARKTRVIRLD